MRRSTKRKLAVTTAVFFVASLLAPAAVLAERPPRRKAPKTGHVEIFCFTKGATVEINAKVVGKTPLTGPLMLKTGEYSVRVFKRGYTEFLETVNIEAGKTAELEADLIAFAGIVRINANVPDATIAIDGKLAGKAPFDKDVPAGKHEFTVQKKGFKPFKQTVEVIAGKALVLDVQLEAVPIVGPATPEPGIHTKWWFWTIIGVVVAGGTTAGVLGAKGGGEVLAPHDDAWQLSQ